MGEGRGLEAKRERSAAAARDAAADEELRICAERYRRLAESSRDLIAELDCDGRLAYLSPNHREILGWAPEELVGRTIREIADRFRLEDAEALEDLPESAATGDGRELRATRRVRHRDGSVRWLECSASSYRTSRGELRVISISRDITDRQRAEETIRQSEANLRNAQRIAHLGSWEWDRDSGVLRASEEAHRIFGLEPGVDDLGAAVSMESVHAEDREHLARALERAVEGGEKIDVEYRVLRPGGDERILHTRAETVLDESGRPRGLRGTGHDITERKQAEEALRTREEWLGAILSSLGGAQVAVYDRDCTLRSLYGEPGISGRYGLRREEALGHRADAYLPEGQPDVGHAELRRVFETGEPSQFQQEVSLPAGLFVFDVHLSPIRSGSGEIRHVLAVCHDVTERVRAEEERLQFERQMLRAQKLESLGVLAAGIAHDFNNLLVAVQGNADLALEELPPGAPARELLEEIAEASEHAAGLTEQLLAYAGKSEPLVRGLDLCELVGESAQLLRTVVRRTTALRIETETDSAWIRADATQIRQVLLNLTANADEALAGGSGAVTIRTGTLPAEASPRAECFPAGAPAEGDCAFLEVADDGTGMAPETVARIFDPFFTTKFQGRGLGLAAVVGIVRGHGGAVAVESVPGEGTTFRVLLPRVGGRPEPEAGAVGGGGRRRGFGTLLVVDDEAAVLKVARRMLETLGYHVLTAPSGPAALDVFAKRGDEIAGVLVDFAMPGMNGEETIRALRERRRDLPAAIMSGYTDPEEGRSAVPRLQKPFRLAGLSEKIEAMLGQQA